MVLLYTFGKKKKKKISQTHSPIRVKKVIFFAKETNYGSIF